MAQKPNLFSNRASTAGEPHSLMQKQLHNIEYHPQIFEDSFPGYHPFWIIYPMNARLFRAIPPGGIPINVPLLPNKNALGEYVSAIAIRSFARYLSQKTSNNGKRA
jgi:hypothetical protein